MFYLLLASFLWGTSFIAGKIAYQMADPTLIVLFRLLIASAITLPITFKFMKNSSLSSDVWRKIALLGALTYPATFLLQFIGLKYTSAASAATMIGLEPLMVVMIGSLFFKEKISLNILALSMVAFIGVVLVVGVSNDPNISLPGCLLVLASTVVVAFWLRLSKSILKNMDAKIYTALSLQLGTLIGLPFILSLNLNWDITPSTEGIMAVLYLGIGCSLFAGWFWNKGLEQNPAHVGGLFLALEPVFGVLMAVVLLQETLTFTSILGVLLVIFAAGASMFLPLKKRT